jgi:hypothetical protein
MVIFVFSAAVVVGLVAPPPLFRIPPAASLYDAGLAHGRLAAPRITQYLATAELRALSAFAFGTAAGRAAFTQLAADNGAEFPEYAEEMRGIAAGANQTLDTVWMINLLQELENVNPSALPSRTARHEDHCSDFMAAPSGGGLFHGHNEDWDDELRPLVYFVSYTPATTAAGPANFSAVAGLCYPGMIIGNAVTFNARGVYYTQNALFPTASLGRGLAMNFVQRRALDRAASLQQLHDGLTMATATATATAAAAVAPARAPLGQALGFSLNCVSVSERLASNVEVYEDTAAVTPLARNASHFNMYKHLAGVTDRDEHTASTTHRQARADSLPPPASRADIVARLGDVSDASFPIYRWNMTLVSAVVDGTTGDLDVWANCNPALPGCEPLFRWNILRFFD